MPPARIWDSITAVLVVEDYVPEEELLRALSDQLAEHGADSEIVVVANGVSAEGAHALRQAAVALSDVTVHFLAERIDRDTAALIGMEHALGDWIVMLTPTAAEVRCLERVLANAGPHEIVFAGARPRREIGTLYRSMAGLYFKAYQLLTGLALEWPAPRIRVYSRAAARYVCGHLDGEFLLRSAAFSGAFPSRRLELEGLPQGDARLPTVTQAFRKAMRGLLGASALALRATIALALAGGAIALISSFYAVLVFIFNENVAPGWTTLSLQISVMTLLFSALFALVGEYVLGIYRASVPRRRYPVVREIRSPLRRQEKRLNIVDSDGGSFELGAPKSGNAGGLKAEKVGS